MRRAVLVRTDGDFTSPAASPHFRSARRIDQERSRRVGADQHNHDPAVSVQTAAQDLAQGVSADGLADHAAALRGPGKLRADVPAPAPLAGHRRPRHGDPGQRLLCLASRAQGRADWRPIGRADTTADQIARIRLIFERQFSVPLQINLSPKVCAAWQANIAG